MTTLPKRLHFLLLILLSVSIAACDSESSANGDDDDDDNNGPGKLATGEGPCEEPDQCKGDICVALIDGDHPPVYCTEPCPCPDGFYCDEDTFALAGLNFCRFGDSAPTNPEPPSEPPRLPCKKDSDCENDLVCATYAGVKDCTIPCVTEDDCALPPLGGVTMDLYNCGNDQGTDRTVCLPDTDCFLNPLPCIDGAGF